MKKKLTSWLLVLAMVLTLFPTIAMAAGNSLQVSAGSLSGDDTITVTYTIPNSVVIGALEVKITFDKAKLEATDITWNTVPGFSAFVGSEAADANNNGFFSGSCNSSNLTNITVPANQTLVTANFKIKAGATPGSAAFSVDELVIAELDGTDKTTESGATTTGATVEVVSAISGTQDITGVTAPAKGGTPVTSVTAPTGILANIDWYKQGESTTHVGNFAANTVYQARITVKPDAGYQFADSITFTVDGGSANLTSEKQPDGSYVLTKTFDATTDKVLTGLTVTTQPSKTTYVHGDGFDPAGMVVKAEYDDGTSNNDFKGYAVEYATVGKGYLCKGDTKVTLKKDGKSVDVTGLTVNAKALTVTGLTAVDREYEAGYTLVNLNGGTLTGVVSGETVSLLSTPTTGRISNAGVGNNKDVSIDPLSLTGTDAGNYTLTQPTGIKVNITRKDIDGANITLGTQATYNGTEQGVQIASVKDGAAVLISTIDYAIEDGGKATDVGNNTLVIKGMGNYTGTARATWSLVAKDVTITPDAKSKTYGAADPTLTYTTSIDGDATLKPLFDAAKSGTLSYTGTDVGAYPITLGSLAADNNFNLKLAAATVNFTINKATPSITATSPRQLVKNGVEVDISNWASFTNTDSGAQLTYALDGTPTGITLTADNKLKADPSTSTTTFNIKVNAAATTNFAAPTEEVIAVNVVTKFDAGVSIATPPASKTYGDEDFTLTATKTAPDGGTWNWTSSDDTILEIVSGADTATPTIKVKKADTTGATLTVTYTSSTHYGSANATITVAQKEVTVAPGSYKVSKKYDGTTGIGTSSGALSVSGILTDDTVTVTTTPVAYTNANVGGQSTMDVNITLVGSGNTNYKIKGGATTVSVPCEITAKEVSVTGITATNRTYAKDNLKVALTGGTLTGVISGDTVTVDLTNAKGTMTDANVGNGKAVTVTGVKLGGADKGNYRLKEQPTGVTVNITKATALTLEDIPVSQKYTVTTGEKAIGAVMPADAGTLTYTEGTENKTGSVTVTSWNVDSTGKVTYTLSGGVASDTVTLPVIIGSDNYEDSTVNVKITLTAKDDQAALTLTGETTVVYGQTLQLGTSGGNGNGAVTYTVTPGTGTATIDATGKLTPTKAGTVTVTATKAADANYNSGTSAPVTITITKATPTGEPKYTAITTSGKTLADAGLTTAGSNLSVPGTVKWVDDTGADLPATTTVEANTTYKWLFTPTDTNYTTLTGSIQLWHKSTSSGGGSYYAPTVPDMPMLYRGCTGDAVKTLQEKLNAKGFDSGNVDGIFGAKTYAAATAFQKANGLGVDGIVGKLTWAKLYDATPVNVTPVTTQPMIRTGSRGDAVRKLQELLNAKGYTCGSVDGIFGSKTYAAVLAFQKANGLAADGIVGPLTWGKLV